MLVGVIIGVLIATVLNSILIFIVGRLRLGMEVDGFGPAFRAGLLIAIGGALAAWLWSVTGGTPATGVAGAISNLIVATGVLFAAGRAIDGMRVHGVGGALLAAIAIAALGWLISAALGSFI